uniref:Unkown protein n=1 Tax=Riptortus pedestris TaxID=329032 RepID=R4WKK3_RIPPE|nr:unkown protein [Riptortus pedestris]
MRCCDPCFSVNVSRNVLAVLVAILLNIYNIYLLLYIRILYNLFDYCINKFCSTKKRIYIYIYFSSFPPYKFLK